MKSKRRSVSSYTKNEILIISRKFSNRTDFHNHARPIWRAAKILGVYYECTAHMREKQKPKGYWTKKLCQIEALKFVTRYDFFKFGSAAYQAAKKSGWLNEICAHMQEVRKSRGHWRNLDNLLSEAKKYKSRKAFAKGAPGAYGAASEMDVLDFVCKHMPSMGNLKRRLVYAWEFPGKVVYVGLTQDVEDREKRRKNSASDAVMIYRRKTGKAGKLVLKTEFLPVEEARKNEAYFKELYQERGWKVLNRVKTGAVGGNIIIWTKENCLKMARTCSSKQQFYTLHPCAYGAACEHGWLPDCYKHIKSKRKLNGHWSDENISQVVKQCKTRTEFETKFGSAAAAAYRRGTYRTLTMRLPYLKLPNDYWTFRRILEKASKCGSIHDFISRHRNIYQAARKRGLLSQLYKRMNWIRRGHLRPLIK